jgi:hypothetical protein
MDRHPLIRRLPGPVVIAIWIVLLVCERLWARLWRR